MHKMIRHTCTKVSEKFAIAETKFPFMGAGMRISVWWQDARSGSQPLQSPEEKSSLGQSVVDKNAIEENTTGGAQLIEFNFDDRMIMMDGEEGKVNASAAPAFLRNFQED